MKGNGNKIMPNTISKNEKIQNILQKCNGYLENNIRSEMSNTPETEEEYLYFSNFADASALVHNPTIQKFKVIEHYYDSDRTNNYLESQKEYFVIEKSNGILYCFVIYTSFKRNLALYHELDESPLKNLLCENSVYISKNIGEIATLYKIPYPYEIPLLFKDYCYHLH